MERIHTYDEDKVVFHNYDAYVSKVQSCHMTSVASLIEYFKEPIIEDENREIFLARAFFMWLANMETNLVHGLPDDINSILQKNTVHAFAALCESANIQHQVVEGISKGLGYLPGHDESNKGIINFCWNTFKSNDRWHIVDVDRGIFSRTGYSRGGEILLESEGQTLLKETEESVGNCVIDINDFWFCLNPSIYIFYSFPDDPEWQLLPIAKRISKAEFFSSPLFQDSFFIAKLHMLSEHTGLLYSKNGKCTISFGANKVDTRYMSMTYGLSLKKDTVNLNEIDARDLPLLVLYAPSIDTFTFNIRFPVAAEYIFEIYVSAPDIKYSGCYLFATFKIICSQPDPNCKKLPLHTGSTGYGFGYTAIDFGLKNPSTSLPNVHVECGQKDEVDMTELTFQIDSDKINEAEFLSDIVGEEHNENVVTNTRVDEIHGKLHVSAGMKKQGEYALSIIARDKRTDKYFARIVNYLLTTNSTEEDEEMKLQLKKRKKELTLQSKLQKRHEKKDSLTAKIKDIELEIDNLKNSSDEITDDVTVKEDMKKIKSPATMASATEGASRNSLKADVSQSKSCVVL
ncbi:kyphoscoliosis peptidase-like [Ruditapes philippinarum]|uniref:kyphoscoliosis peptidase-like n=1 Tax=Ruditapes philippinarum TaxID=129788 RepID=UPI00295C128C|nr:kyphoscoliosis peptidase-like [Ruditapes philippinarum]